MEEGVDFLSDAPLLRAGSIEGQYQSRRQEVDLHARLFRPVAIQASTFARLSNCSAEVAGFPVVFQVIVIELQVFRGDSKGNLTRLARFQVYFLKSF